MKRFGSVAIVCDRNFGESPKALRGLLESMQLQVTLVRVIQAHQLEGFFRDDAPGFAYTILSTHGDGPDQSPRIRFDVAQQEESQDDTPQAWSTTQISLGPENVGTYMRGRMRGTLVTLACGSGRSVLLTSLLEQGYHTVIGPDASYFDADAAQLFTMAYFYYLLSADRSDSPAMSPGEAFDRAPALDPDNPVGPRVLRQSTRRPAPPPA